MLKKKGGARSSEEKSQGKGRQDRRSPACKVADHMTSIVLLRKGKKKPKGLK